MAIILTPRLPTERSFGLSVGLVSAALAAFRLWRGIDTLGIAVAILAMVLVGAALLYPPALRSANRVWFRFAHVLGFINARIVLSAFFLLVLTPVGLLMRLFGRNPLRSADHSTNWSAYPARRRDSKHYEHLF